MTETRALGFDVCPDDGVSAWGGLSHNRECRVLRCENDRPDALDGDKVASRVVGCALVREVNRADGELLLRQSLKLWRELHKIPLAAIFQNALKPFLVEQGFGLRGRHHHHEGKGGGDRSHFPNIAIVRA